jgi:hypothetical protein
MTRPFRFFVGIVILIMTGSMYGCDGGGGIGVGSSIGGARWGGGGSNPGVIVMGGPVYR